MIVIDLANTNPMTMTGESTTSQHTVYSNQTGVTRPDLTGCNTSFTNPTVYKNKVFADTANPTDTFKNDQNSFLFSKVLAADTVAMELWKEGTKVADLTDDTYGKYFGVGFSSIYPLYFGYRIDWVTVLSAFGAGCYTFRMTGTILGAATEVDSACYYLLPYSPCAVADTVKVKWMQNGNIESAPLELAGLTWIDWIRVPGIFWNNSPSEEIDEIEFTSRKFENVNIQSIDEFTLDLKSVPFWVSKRFDKDICLATSIEVTDYNADNHRNDLVDFEVRFSGYGERDEQRGNCLSRFSYNFKKRTDNDLKREYPRPTTDIK